MKMNPLAKRGSLQCPPPLVSYQYLWEALSFLFFPQRLILNALLHEGDIRLDCLSWSDHSGSWGQQLSQEADSQPSCFMVCDESGWTPNLLEENSRLWGWMSD